MKLILSLFILLFTTTVFATPEKAITEVFSKRLDAIATPESFQKFVSEHKADFPDVKSKNPSMIVEKEELPVNGDTFTIAIGYRQVLIKGSAAFLKELWTTPDHFSEFYDLDGSSKVDGNFTKDHFKARVFKKIPAIEDQDYTLDYTVTNSGKFTFIRARLDKDAKGFALRDNLKTLEETPEGLMVREISYLYPLRWYVRAMGPTARSTMKTELNKVSLIEKCLVETSKDFPPAKDTIKTCSTLTDKE